MRHRRQRQLAAGDSSTRGEGAMVFVDHTYTKELLLLVYLYNSNRRTVPTRKQIIFLVGGSTFFLLNVLSNSFAPRMLQCLHFPYSGSFIQRLAAARQQQNAECSRAFVAFEKTQSRRCDGPSTAHAAAEHSAAWSDLLHEICTRIQKKERIKS